MVSCQVLKIVCDDTVVSYDNIKCTLWNVKCCCDDTAVSSDNIKYEGSCVMLCEILMLFFHQVIIL